MKHPNNMVLQKFVDNELNPFHENLIREHLLNCPMCSQVVHEMKEINLGLRREQMMSMPLTRKNELFQAAKLSLRKNKEKLRRKESFKDFFHQLIDLRTPAISLGSIAALVFVLAQIEKSNYEYENLLSMEVEVFEGENNESSDSSIAK